MAQTKKPRKKYNPNKTAFNESPLIKIDKSQAEQLKLRVYISLDKFRDKTAHEGDFYALRFRIKCGLGLAMHFNESLDHYFNSALALLDKVKERFVKNQQWMMGHPEIDQLKIALDIADQIQDKSTRKEQLPIFEAVYKELTTSH